MHENWTELTTDVLILGSGLAGLLLSILLHDRGAAVTLASKETFSDSNTFYAQGGLAAVVPGSSADSLAEHLNDTLKSGAGLTDYAVAREIIDTAPYLVRELTRLGTNFDKSSNGDFAAAREGGHGKARVLHSKDTTGKAISSALIQSAIAKAAGQSDYNMIEYCFAYNLLSDGKRITGAEVIHNGVSKRIHAQHVVLATGGAGQIFSRTTNPHVATADGVALAYRAGAALADLEFVQFHPTALSLPGAPAFLISEAVRGAGAVLLNGKDKPFVKNFHPDGDLATRDVVARAIHQTMMVEKLASVNLDLRPIGQERLLQEFPNIVETCRQYGVDPLTRPVPICPAAHYFMGGVLSDASGRTSLPGLYAIGEVACSGLHGANRLASNSLLEAGVMAIKLAEMLASGESTKGISRSILHDSMPRSSTQPESMPRNSSQPESTPRNSFDAANILIPASTVDFKSNMYEYASLVRNQANLNSLLDYIHSNNTALANLNVAHMTAANILLVGELIATAARNRTESRGSHYREDFPHTDDSSFARRQAVTSGQWHWLDHTPGLTKIDKQSTFAA